MLKKAIRPKFEKNISNLLRQHEEFFIEPIFWFFGRKISNPPPTFTRMFHLVVIYWLRLYLSLTLSLDVAQIQGSFFYPLKSTK